MDRPDFPVDECRCQNRAIGIPDVDGETVAAGERLELFGNVGERQRRLDLRGPPTGQIETFLVDDERFTIPDIKVELRH